VDNLESVICDIQEEIADLRSRRVKLDQTLEALETRAGGWSKVSRPRPTSTAVRICGEYSICPPAYREIPRLRPLYQPTAVTRSVRNEVIA
jgi:hypothetical protein